MSKLFERDMYNQIIIYIEKYLSPYLFGLRKGYSTAQCLNDQNKYVGAVLTDLSKAFDCLNHQLLIAKLEAYGFGKQALNFIYNYLYNRNQRTKVNSKCSTWREIRSGVPQGSILGPLLFNIFLNYIFLFVVSTKITNYADDNTPYAIESSIEKLIESLEHDSTILLNWFQVNEMKSNNFVLRVSQYLFHLLLILDQYQKNTIFILRKHLVLLCFISSVAAQLK